MEWRCGPECPLWQPYNDGWRSRTQPRTGSCACYTADTYTTKEGDICGWLMMEWTALHDKLTAAIAARKEKEEME